MATGKLRVLRGGSWINIPVNCRAAFRDSFIPERGYGSGGFRVAVVAADSN